MKMRQTFKQVLTGLVGLMCSYTAFAASDENIYLGGGVSVQSFSAASLDNRYLMSMAVVRLGADINKYFGAEARFGFSGTSSLKTEAGRNMEISNTAMYGGYLKPRLTLGPVGAYGLVGVTYYDLYSKTRQLLEEHFEPDATRPSVGAGLELNLSSFTMLKNVRLFTEGMLYGYEADSEEMLVGFEAGGVLLF